MEENRPWGEIVFIVLAFLSPIILVVSVILIGQVMDQTEIGKVRLVMQHQKECAECRKKCKGDGAMPELKRLYLIDPNGFTKDFFVSRVAELEALDARWQAAVRKYADIHMRESYLFKAMSSGILEDIEKELGIEVPE